MRAARWVAVLAVLVTLLGCGAGGGRAGYPEDPGEPPAVEDAPYEPPARLRPENDPRLQDAPEEQYQQGREDVADECADAGDYDDVTACLEENR